MSVEVRVSDPRVGSNLLDFFQRNGLRAALDGDRVTVEPRPAPVERQLMEVTLLLRIWQIVNPDVEFEIGPSQ